MCTCTCAGEGVSLCVGLYVSCVLLYRCVGAFVVGTVPRVNVGRCVCVCVCVYMLVVAYVNACTCLCLWLRMCKRVHVYVGVCVCVCLCRGYCTTSQGLLNWVEVDLSACPAFSFRVICVGVVCIVASECRCVNVGVCMRVYVGFCLYLCMKMSVFSSVSIFVFVCIYV